MTDLYLPANWDQAASSISTAVPGSLDVHKYLRDLKCGVQDIFEVRATGA